MATLALSVAIVAGVVAAAGAVGAGPVGETLAAHGDGNDFEPPRMTNVSRQSTTTVEMRISDNHDVEEETIDAGDFDVSPGSISDIETSEDGTDAVIEVTLTGVGNEAVTISTAGGANVSDTNGNEFDPTNQFSEIVPAPDDQPELARMTRINASTIEAYFLDEDGIDEETVDPGDFRTNRSDVEEVTVEANGTNATVRLLLEENAGFEPLVVGLSGGADVADTNGTTVERPFRDFRVRGVTAPTLEGVSKRSTTEIELFFIDETDVAEGSFQAHDFQVAKPRRDDVAVSAIVGNGNFNDDALFDVPLADVRASEDGSNATVVLELARPVDVDELLVRVRDDAVITDTEGHEMDPTDEDTESWEIIDGMDGVPPEVERFDATESSSDAVELSIAASERLAGLNVSVEGAVSDQLDRSAFAFDGSTNTYRATYTPDAEGDVTFRLEGVTDGSGNRRAVDVVRASGLDRSGPEPVIAIDFRASENLTLVFDGRHTTDLTGVSSYTWSFDDGTEATGERATKTFDPGRQTVTLTATDPTGRNGTTSVTLELQPGIGDLETDALEGLAGVRRVADPSARVIQPGGGPAETALLEVRTPSPGIPVGAAEGPGVDLARNGDLVLEDIEVVPARYRGFTLGVSASAPGPVSAAAEATETRPVGGFTVAHDVPEAGFQAVTVVASVDTGSLAEMDAEPADLTVLRETDDGWQRLETTPVSGSENEGRTRIRADSPGLSRFAVVLEDGTEARAETTTPTANGSTDEESTATPTPTPSPGTAGVVVTNATLSRESVDTGTTVLVNATVRNRADGNAIYVAGLSVNGTVAATESVTLPAGESRSISFEYAPERPGTYPVAVNGTEAGELTVASPGLFASVLGVFGFLPLGLLGPVAVFVGLPVLVIYLVLKALAIYLGY